MKTKCFLLSLAGALALLAAPFTASAQWLTQSFSLKPGWNAVYLHVDASHATVGSAVAGTYIDEVWMWAPNPATTQFVETPQQPLDTGSQWLSWKSTNAGASVLQRLVGNTACLVYANTNAPANFTWTVKGRPVQPNHQWTVSGLNFLGFPTAAASPPTFENFLAQAPALQQTAEIYQYLGGALGANNPARLFAYRTTPVQRGQAFWMRATNLYNRYYGPFEITSSSAGGVNFAENLSAVSLRLRNLTANNLTVTLQYADSETPPTNQPAIAGAPPLLVRGSLNTTNLTYGYAGLAVGGSQSWLLNPAGQPGSDAEVVLGLNRSAITATPGVLLAGIIRLTDSLGHSQVDLPVSATAASTAGLWVGGAMATQVGQYLKTYQRDANDKPVATANGEYIVTAVNTNLGAVPRFFPLRLIVHNPTNGAGAVLLQRVYVGLNAYTNPVVATREAVLGRAFLADARRVSATHLPWTEANAGWAFTGKLGLAATVTATVANDYNDHASNPFVHTYHPDHDTRDATFQTVLAQGAESYTVVRDITLSITPPANDFASLTAASQTLGGIYAETIRLVGLARAGGTNDTRQFEVRGAFTLNRINDVPILTTTP